MTVLNTRILAEKKYRAGGDVDVRYKFEYRVEFRGKVEDWRTPGYSILVDHEAVFPQSSDLEEVKAYRDAYVKDYVVKEETEVLEEKVHINQ